MDMQLFQLQPLLGLFFIGGLFGGLLGLLVTIFMIWMLIDCIGNGSLDGTKKIIWALVIIIFPLVGSLLYFFLVRNGSPRPLV